MKLLGSADDGGGRPRSQDDAAVGYVFQRHGHEPEFTQYAQKQSRWAATGEDAIVDVRRRIEIFCRKQRAVFS